MIAIPVAAGIGIVVLGFQLRIYLLVFLGFLMIFVSLCCGLPYLNKCGESPVEEQRPTQSIREPSAVAVIIESRVQESYRHTRPWRDPVAVMIETRIQEIYRHTRLRQDPVAEQGEIVMGIPVETESRAQEQGENVIRFPRIPAGYVDVYDSSAAPV